MMMWCHPFFFASLHTPSSTMHHSMILVMLTVYCSLAKGAPTGQPLEHSPSKNHEKSKTDSKLLDLNLHPEEQEGHSPVNEWDLNLTPPEEQPPVPSQAGTGHNNDSPSVSNALSLVPSSSGIKESGPLEFTSNVHPLIKDFKGRRSNSFTERSRSMKSIYDDSQRLNQAGTSNIDIPSSSKQAPISSKSATSLPEKYSEAGSSVVKGNGKMYFQERRKAYNPPERFGNKVKEHFRYWYEHADQVQEFNRGQRPDRPRLDRKVPFVLDHAMQLKKSKVKEKVSRKKYGDNRTDDEILRDAQDWQMIQDGENLRMRVMQLHRIAVAKQLGISRDEVTQKLGRENGVPFFNSQKSLNVQSSTTSKKRKTEAVESSASSRTAKGKEHVVEH
jgi:hypothetical protein